MLGRVLIHKQFLFYKQQLSFMSTFEDDFKSIITNLKSDVRQNKDGEILVKCCRLCDKKNKMAEGNLWKLVIRNNASFYCYRCAFGGKHPL